MYTVYVLKSLKTGKRYIGYTRNLTRRFWEHNHSKKGFNYRHKPFKIIYRTFFESKLKAIEFERYLKKLKGGNQYGPLRL